MNKASGSNHLESLGTASDYSDFDGFESERIDYDPWSYCANSDLFQRPSKFWGQRTLSDEEYERQADDMEKFCRGDDRVCGPVPSRKRRR